MMSHDHNDVGEDVDDCRAIGNAKSRTSDHSDMVTTIRAMLAMVQVAIMAVNDHMIMKMVVVILTIAMDVDHCVVNYNGCRGHMLLSALMLLRRCGC